MSNNGIDAFNKLMGVLDDAENGRKREDVSEQGAKSMDDILRNFNNAVTQVSGLSQKSDKRIDQIKDTELVAEHTLRIGEYTIQKNDGEYSLIDENGVVLVDNVLLYETVYSIASHLYEGKTFSSSKIVSLLHNNGRYEKHINEARMNKRNYSKYKNEHDFDAMDLENTKFEENKHRAKTIKNNILNEYRNLGK